MLDNGTITRRRRLRRAETVIFTAVASAVLGAQAVAQQPAAATAARAQASVAAVGNDATFGYIVAAAAIFAVLVTSIGVINRLGRKLEAVGGEKPPRRWSLRDALSEEVDFTRPDGSKETLMIASSSRLIAFLGLIVLLALFLAVGSVIIVQLSATGTVADLTSVEHYFLAGLALFVPYGFNQISSAFASLGK